jgi:hypothetical protein
MSDSPVIETEMRDEYDFSRATRGNPYRQLVRRVTIETTGADRVVQIKTIEVIVIVEPDGTVTFKLPPEIPPGEHRMTVLIQIEETKVSDRASN